MLETFNHTAIETSHVERRWLDLSYANYSEAQKLDIHLPGTGKGPFPLLVFIHGGGWINGDKGDISDTLLRKALDRNYAVATVNYRLSGEAHFPCQIYDCKAAIHYIRANARKYRLDDKHIGVWGVSAGGHLAALLGTSAKVRGLEDFSIRNSNTRTSSQVQAVVVWSGPIGNFLTMDEELVQSGRGAPHHCSPDSPESRLLGRTIIEVPALVEFASPMTYIDESTPPFLIQHGLQDVVVPVEQSIRFAEKLEKNAGSSRATLEIMKDAKHADPVFETSKNLGRVLDFFDLYLKVNQKSRSLQYIPSHYAIRSTAAPADTSHIKRRFLDIPYAYLSPAQRLDIYLPKHKKGPFPVIMVFHKGAFIGCDKGDRQILPMLEGLQRGYAVVAVNYRLSGEAKFPAQIQDAKAAVRWIRGNAVQYKFNPNKIAAWGSAAGGYLAMMLGASAGIPGLEDLSQGNPHQACNVQAVVTWHGPVNFLKMDEQLEESGLLPTPGLRHNEWNSPESLLLGQSLIEIPEKVKVASPETYLRRNAPPFLLQHGSRDAVVPVQQSIEFAAKLKQVLGDERVVLELFEGAVHADARFETMGNVNRVLDFFDACLK
jgi:acetyl esterase/lipase